MARGSREASSVGALGVFAPLCLQFVARAIAQLHGSDFRIAPAVIQAVLQSCGQDTGPSGLICRESQQLAVAQGAAADLSSTNS